MVFIGFIYLILSDMTDNINNKPYTLEVKDKYLSPEEHEAAGVNMGDNEFQTEFILGFLAYTEDGTWDMEFNPLDNDYIEVFTSYWDTIKNQEEGKPWMFFRKGPEIELCSKARLLKLFDADNAALR